MSFQMQGHTANNIITLFLVLNTFVWSQMITEALLHRSSNSAHSRRRTICIAATRPDINGNSRKTNALQQLEDIQPKIPLYLPGSNQAIRTVAAPMVAASDYPFRCLCRQYRTDLVFTQMWHSKNYVEQDPFRRNHYDLFEYRNSSRDSNKNILLPAQENLLKRDKDGYVPSNKCEPPDSNATCGPVIVQLAGHEPDIVVRAAEMILEASEHQVAGIDLNLGCPQGIARKGNYGAFLMESDEARVYAVLKTLRKRLPASVAVSAKIRLPLDPSAQEGRIQRLAETGIHFLTVHGRDLTENKTKTGPVHVDRLRDAVQTANDCGIPVIANGGIESFHDAIQILHETGAAAIMSSEALLERPNLFAAADIPTTPRGRLEEQLRLASEYLEWARFSPPLPGVLGEQNGSFNCIRTHLFKILYRFLEDHVDLRDTLACHRSCNRLEQAQDLVGILQERYHRLSDEELASCSSSDYPNSSWYRRHWNAPEQGENKRSDSLFETADVLSIDERKELIKNRISKLRADKQKKLLI
jgi:tRNA-dihydrouridine synthase